MELLVASAIGILTAGGIYLVLRLRTFPVILGVSLLTYAVNVFLFASGPAADFHPVGRYLDGYLAIILLIGAVLSVPSAARLQGRAARAFPTLAAPGREALFWALLIASVASVGAASYSPFIYFRF